MCGCRRTKKVGVIRDNRGRGRSKVRQVEVEFTGGRLAGGVTVEYDVRWKGERTL